MKNILKFLLVITLMFLSSGEVFAADNYQAGKTVEIKKAQVVDRDLFATGENVIISGTVNGDVYAAGASILVDGTINGDLLAAGATITILGNVADDVRAAASNISIKGTVGKNVVAFGNSITLGENGKVGGSFLTGGNTIDLGGIITKDLRIYGNQVLLSGNFDRDVNGIWQQLTLISTAKINGNLDYQSPNQTEVNKNQVAGKVSYSLPKEEVRQNMMVAKPKVEGLFQAFKFGSTIFGWMVAIIFGFIYLTLFKQKAENINQIIDNQLWKSLGLGMLVLFLSPLVCFFLLISIVGIPFLLLLLPFYIFLLYFIKIPVAICLGKKILPDKNNIWALVLGLAIYYGFSFIPFLGLITGPIFVAVGLGALILSFRKTENNPVV